ncbi:MAG TPA: acyltransferase [Candidatus Acidoferrales bacterium]|nr:acyltransferase [Candidatus Acidoferrales bacterium]
MEPTPATISADRLPSHIFGGGTVSEGGRRTFEALDGIRGIAVLAVMLSHFERFLPAVSVLVPLKIAFTFGWTGVDLFFALSGFLITGILMQTRTAVNYFQSFYARRFLRIFPIYYATLIVVFAVAAFVPSIPNVPPPSERWLYFAYLENWIPLWTGTFPPNVVGHFWSLAVEEQFYIVWPLCVLMLTPRGVLRTAIGLCVAALALRCVWVAHSGPSEALMLGTVTRMDSLLVGTIAAVLFTGIGGPGARKHLTAIGLTALGLWIAGIVVTTWHASPTASFGFVSTVGYTIFAIACGALVLGAAVGDGGRGFVQRVFRNGALMRVGKYSYGMYVYHVPMLGICELLVWRHLPPAATQNPLLAVAYVAFLGIATFGVAAVSYELVERRLLALKRHVEPKFLLSDPTLEAHV